MHAWEFGEGSKVKLTIILFLSTLAVAQSPRPTPASPVSVDLNCEQCPSSPSAQQPKPSFLTFRKSWEDPPLRSSKQVFTSKVFIIAHAAMFASMAVACRNSRSGEEFHSELPAMFAVTGMDYLMYRFFSGMHMLGAPVYATARYVKAATK